MEIQKIGEFGLIDRLTKDIKPQNTSTKYGVGDDCAVLHYPDSEVLTRAEVKSGDSMPIPEIGYNYTIEFTVNGRNEKAGTELFRSHSAVFYLADPATGMMGYERDGYSYRLPYRVTPGCKDRIRITGDNLSTQLYVNGRLVADRQPLDLTLREFELLKYLATRDDKVFSREQLLEDVWGYEYYGDIRTVDVTVRRLREKLEDDPGDPKYIITKRGIGYYFSKQ